MSKTKSQHLETYPRLSVGIREMDLARHNRRRSRRRAASKSRLGSSLDTRQGGAVEVSGIHGLAGRGSFASSLFLNRACHLDQPPQWWRLGQPREEGQQQRDLDHHDWLPPPRQDRRAELRGGVFGPSPSSSPKTNVLLPSLGLSSREWDRGLMTGEYVKTGRTSDSVSVNLCSRPY